MGLKNKDNQSHRNFSPSFSCCCFVLAVLHGLWDLSFSSRDATQAPGSESEVKSLSRVQLFVTPWTVAFQAPLSMGFSRQ